MKAISCFAHTCILVLVIFQLCCPSFASVIASSSVHSTSSSASSTIPPSPSSSSIPASSASVPPSTTSSASASASASLAAPNGPTALPAPPPLKPGQLPNSFPVSPNITSTTSFDPSWQNTFSVIQGLPNISFALARNFAGNLPVGRAGHPNNTLFFWGTEHTEGSLTASAEQLSSVPWMIWLGGGGGGPASSGILASMIANGPMLIDTADYTVSQNARSLSNLVDIFWVDQPVGVGYSTVDSDGYAANEQDVANDFIGFLSNLVKVFPSLEKRPLILAGEDYSGIYISYIAQALLSASNPPASLEKIVIGNGLLGDFALYPDLSTVSILESFPQLINFDEGVFNAFASKAQLCNYNFNLTYPQSNPLPSLPVAPRRSNFWSSFRNETQVPGILYKRDQNLKRQSPSLGNALDPFYGCALFDEMIDYAVNFSAPWGSGSFDLFDVSNTLSPKVTFDGGVYFNSLQVREALSAPFSKNWTSVNAYPFGSTTKPSSSSNIFGDPSPSTATFFENFVSGAIDKNVSIILYSGSNNAIANHHALEVLIQNTTFGGTRGFSRKPSTPWKDDSGATAGIVHTERRLTYALFDHAGALVPRAAPGAAYTFFSNFVLASSGTGTLTVDSSGNAAVLGGEDAAAADDVPRVASAVYAGAATTASTLAAPAASLTAWAQFVHPLNDTVQNAAIGHGAAPHALAAVVAMVLLVLMH